MNKDNGILRVNQKLHCTGVTPYALPLSQSQHGANFAQKGVSTHCILNSATNDVSTFKNTPPEHWYALRATYGREKLAHDYLISKGVKAFCPMQKVTKFINGKRKTLYVSRLPNIFFAYGTVEVIKSYVYDNVNLPYLRFYYRHQHIGNRIKHFPMVVPSEQIESLKVICQAEAEDIILAPFNIHKFSKGQLVQIVEGKFKGVIGRVARYHGQNRIGIYIDGLLTMATAYVPKNFIKPIDVINE